MRTPDTTILGDMRAKKIKILELFAGSRSIGKVCDELGYECFSIDSEPFDGIDLVKDIEFLTLSDIPFRPNIIWASPPCTTYSIAGIGNHRDMGTPKTEFAEKSDRLVCNTLKIIQSYPEAHYYMENPRGYLRKMPFMSGFPRTTIWYCRYGDNAAKPTDIWSNNIWNPMFNKRGWKGKPECWNNNKKCHHDRQPRGYSAKVKANAIGKGTQGKKNAYERSKIPYELCLEILQA